MGLPGVENESSPCGIILDPFSDQLGPKSNFSPQGLQTRDNLSPHEFPYYSQPYMHHHSGVQAALEKQLLVQGEVGGREAPVRPPPPAPRPACPPRPPARRATARLPACGRGPMDTENTCRTRLGSIQ